MNDPEMMVLVAIKHCFENRELSHFLSSKKAYERFINTLINTLIFNDSFREEFFSSGGDMDFSVTKEGELLL